VSGPAFDYQLFGLRVRSEIELPELTPAAPAAEPDVRVRLGRVDLPDQGPGLTAHDGALGLSIANVARFLVTGGRDILVEPVAGIDPRNVRIFLLGSAFGALLHQRGLFPLHANAVAIEGKAVAFMGPSGSGKSTLAAWFHDRGDTVLADDVCVVRFDADGRPLAMPGIPRLRLWIDAIERLGRDPAGLERSYIDEAQSQDKFNVPIDRSAAGDPVALAAIYRLDRGSAFAIDELSGIEAVDALFANTYRGAWVAEAGSHREHWASALRLVRATRVFRVSRTWDARAADEEAELLRAHALRIAHAGA
jgi:hypothetical protein